MCIAVFADIAGFTAWSSVRDPGQVFTLLEQAYGSFDAIAKQRGVFKVETIGDCYVAVAGLPVPNPQHAVTMVRFASDCRDAFQRVARDLEVTLGVGTADLQFRFGLNSGPCTAGVLRGEKSRFQLFGDTVNTGKLHCNISLLVSSAHSNACPTSCQNGNTLDGRPCPLFQILCVAS